SSEESASQGFAAMLAVLKQERLKVDKARSCERSFLSSSVSGDSNFLSEGDAEKASVKEITTPNEVTDPVLGFLNPASQCHTCGAKDSELVKVA
nr:DNA-directed RNA polymerase IV subunit 1 isoform X1 [Tanacetum cinerariifolium]